MGVLNEIVIAEQSEAEEIAKIFSPVSEYEGIELKGCNEVVLSYLYAILFEREWKAEMADLFTLIYGEDPDGPWISDIPGEMTAKLAKLEVDEIEAIGEKWALMEELSDSESDLVIDGLEQLVELAQKAVSGKKDLLLWTSL